MIYTKNLNRKFIKKILVIFSITFFYPQLNFAQQCGNCKETPTVASYDFDIQVTQPGEDSPDLQSWKQLFWLARHANKSLFENNKKCIKFIQPSYASVSDESFVTMDGVEVPNLITPGEIMKVGETVANVPKEGNLGYGEYITTGSVKKVGEGYVLHVEIQTSCGRKTFAGANIPFQLSSDSKYIEGIAQQAAAKLSPIIDKIKSFELEERQKDKKLSIFKTSWGEPIKIILQKKTLKAGESTDFTIELKDCDGVALQGREILFNETSFDGFKIFGTMGGTVTPAKLITDINGKATAKFTLKTGATKAIINAHSPGNEVKGCTSMFIGDAAINIRKVYSGFVKYSYDETAKCEETSKSETGVRTDYYSANNLFKIDYNAGFYIDEKGQMSFSGEEESNSPTDIPNVIESGKMIFKTKEIRRSKVSNNPPTEQIITKDQSGGLISGDVDFSLNDKSQSVRLSLKFALKGTSSFKQTYLPGGSQPADEKYSHSISFNIPIDENLKYKQTTEGGKLKHNFTYFRDGSVGCKQIIERMQLTVIEE